MKIATPGMVATHQWSRMNLRPAEIIAPHSGSGGWAPMPRKPSPAAVRITPAMSSVIRMMIEERQSGQIWPMMIRIAPAPWSWIAAM